MVAYRILIHTEPKADDSCRRSDLGPVVGGTITLTRHSSFFSFGAFKGILVFQVQLYENGQNYENIVSKYFHIHYFWLPVHKYEQLSLDFFQLFFIFKLITL